ncbi:MAG: diguanylate cyclase [Lachnospiraceae bacterium]|nr:diguanylate cyclase [Lachnospiraceae bacterium]
MTTEQYLQDDTIKEFLEYAEASRFVEPQAVIDKAMELLPVAEKRHDVNLRGLLYYYIGDCLYTLNKTEESFSYLERATRDLSYAKNWERMGICYNLLGLMLSHQGNIVSSIESMYEAIEIAEKHELYLLATMVYANLGEIFCDIGNYQEAFRLEKISMEYSEKVSDSQQNKVLDVVLALSIQLVKTCILTGQLKLAEIYMEKSMALQEKVETDFRTLSIRIVAVLLAKAQGNSEKEAEELQYAIQEFRNCKYKIDYFTDCFDLMNYLNEKGDNDILEEMIASIEKSIQDNEYPDIRMKLSALKLDVFHRKNITEANVEEFRRFVKYAQAQAVQNNRNVYQFIEIRNNLKKMKNQNSELKQEADTDGLTKLPNRRKLNEVADKYFELADTYKESLGVEMLDIDHFKAINDKYGHKIGDECLIALAEVLKLMKRDGMFCARYGGDEFFILYMGFEDDAIHEICGMLNTTLARVLEERDLPKFTISQGICNHVPRALNKVWDYTSSADAALYRTKDTGGNGVLLIHSAKELNENH